MSDDQNMIVNETGSREAVIEALAAAHVLKDRVIQVACAIAKQRISWEYGHDEIIGSVIVVDMDPVFRGPGSWTEDPGSATVSVLFGIDLAHEVYPDCVMDEAINVPLRYLWTKEWKKALDLDTRQDSARHVLDRAERAIEYKRILLGQMRERLSRSEDEARKLVTDLAAGIEHHDSELAGLEQATRATTAEIERIEAERAAMSEEEGC